jgi:lipoprotein-anchoring transpeptidase ErfK/SrfK
MGRARLVFNPPYAIHGTDDADSLGDEISGGSIVLSNEAILEVARLVLQEGGAWEGEEWFHEMLSDRDRMRELRLDRPIPIRVTGSIDKPARTEAEDSQDGELRFYVSLNGRMLTVFRGSEVVSTHDVAIGQPDHPTPTGNWRINQVDLNPEWTPPDSEWARDREPKPAGHPENPMGRAKLIYAAPFTIHGTDELDSLGRAASHGSIRVSNEDVIELARLLLREGGVWKGEEWFQEILEDRKQLREIRLDNPVRIQVAKERAGESGARKE